MGFVLFRISYARKTRNQNGRAQRLIEELRKKVPELDKQSVQSVPFFEEPDIGVLVRLPEFDDDQVLVKLRRALEKRKVRFEERFLVDEPPYFGWHEEDTGYFPEREEVEKRLEAGKAFSHMGMLDDARAEFESALSLDPRCTEAYHYLVAILRQLRLLPEAEKWVRKGLLHHQNSSSFQFLAANVFEEMGFFDEALAYVKKSVRLDPDASVAYVTLGRVLHTLGQRDQARLAYEEALSKEMGLAEAALGIGSITLEEGRLEDAMDWLLRAVAMDGHCVEARLKLGWCFLHLGQYEEAELEFLQVANGPRTEFHFSARFSLGRLYLLLGNPSLAKEVLVQVCEAQPQLGDAHRFLAEAYTGLGDYESALYHWQEALVLCPEAELMIKPHLALALTRCGRLEEAEDHLLELLEEEGPRPDLLELLASIAMARDEWVEAKSLLDEAAEADPESAMVCFQRGWVAENLGQLEASRDFYNRAIRLDPTLHEAYSGLGWSFYEEGDYEVSLVLFEKALELLPDNAEFMDHVGWVNLLLSNHAQALGYFEVALAKEPDSHFYRSHLGAALFHLGRTQEARAELNLVLEGCEDRMILAFARYLMALIDRQEGKRSAQREIRDLKNSGELPPEFVALTSGSLLKSKRPKTWKGRTGGRHRRAEKPQPEVRKAEEQGR